jgi:hypothetical protein
MGWKPRNLAVYLLFFPSLCFSEMFLSDDGSRLTVLEESDPVLTYHYAQVDPPPGVAKRYHRSCYVHPLYGLDGDVLTQDYPSDHYHHRGIFWAWPESNVAGRLFNLWLIEQEGETGARQHFEKWSNQGSGPNSAEFAAQNIWRFDDDPTPLVREEVEFRVHSVEGDTRSIEVRLDFKNVCEQDVTLLGAAGKGYGGFCIRPDAERKPLLFYSALGQQAGDTLELESPWADVSSRIRPGGPSSGVTVFQHPSNPGFPHPGWIFRAYGFLGASWPHLDPYTIEPGENVELRYRLLVHRGTGREAGVDRLFDEYAAGAANNR